MTQAKIRNFFALSLMFSFMMSSAQGLTLFSKEQRLGADGKQRIIMDFLERYFTELPRQKHTTIQTKMADDKVFFRKGSLGDLRQIADTMSFSISLLDRYYEVKWLKQEEPFVSIVFPAQYDLLLGMQKDEAPNKLKDLILTEPKSLTMSNRQWQIVPTNLQLQNDSIWQSKTESCELEDLNDATYYYNVGEDYKPVWDSDHLNYSAANLFHGLIADSDYRMYVEQAVYGMKTVSYLINLSQWCNYCKEWGLKVFYGLEEQLEDGLLVIIIAQSREFGFNHLLSVFIPDKFVVSKNSVLKARMTPYIPIHNVKSLFQKESVNHKRIQWQ